MDRPVTGVNDGGRSSVATSPGGRLYWARGQPQATHFSRDRA